MTGDLPSVSVVVPCRNERESIRRCLESILAVSYPRDRLEVLVVDGRSTDGTREVVREFARRSEVLRMLTNPDRIIPAALNRGIAAARGEVIVRMDAHAAYPEDYVRRCVEGLDAYDADNVGGVWRTVPRDDTLVGRAIAAVHTHIVGVGPAWFRLGVDEPREVDTVPYGCYRREVFDRLGGYDERLERTEDSEFNQRLRRSGGRIVLDPEIVSTYLVRSTVGSVTRHRARSGFWTLYVLRFGLPALRARHLAPLAALAAAGVLMVAAPAAAAALLLLYALLVAGAGAQIAWTRGTAVGLLSLPLFPALHGAYALGQAAALPAAAAGRLRDRLAGTAPDGGAPRDPSFRREPEGS